MGGSQQQNAPAPSPLEVLGKLAAVSDAKLLEVVKYLNSMPATAEVLALLDQIRPSLRKLRPPRPPSLKRLWCRPFEDLLRSEPVDDDIGRISRAVIEPCWSQMEARSDNLLQTLQAELNKLPPSQPDRILALGEQLWSRSAELVGRIIADEVELPHLATIRDMLAVGKAIEAFKSAIPGKPIEQFGETELAQAEAGLRDLVQRGLPTSGFLLAIAARLRNPGSLLLLQKRADIGFSASLRRQIAAMAVAAIDDRARDFERMSADANALPKAIAREAEQLMKSLTMGQDQLDEATRRHLDKRTAALTSAVRAAIGERVIKEAPALIESALPGSESAGSRDALIAAEEHAQTLGRSRTVAKWAGLEKEATETAGAICRRFEDKIGELLDQADKDGDGSGSAEQEIYRSIRIIELVNGAQHAQKVLARARQRLKATWATKAAR